MARPRAAALPNLDRVWRDLERWRREGRRGDRIPEVLWRAAGALAREHGVGRISRALRLDYYALQRRVTAGDAGGGSVEFVEVALPGGPAGVQCEIAACDPNGGTVRMKIAGLSPQELAIVVRGVMGSGR